MSHRPPDPAARAALRARLRSARRGLSAEERAGRSARLRAWLAEDGDVASRGLLAGYVAVGGEPDLAALLDPTRPGGVALPRTVGARCTFHRWRGEPLATGALGILEPGEALPIVAPSEVAVWLVPGLAFDVRGNRLGRGAGHYDRVLAGAPGRKIGVAWDFQVVDALPAEPHDVPMDAVVTDAGWVAMRG